MRLDHLPFVTHVFAWGRREMKVHIISVKARVYISFRLQLFLRSFCGFCTVERGC